MFKKTFKKIDKTLLFIEEWSLFVTVAIALLTAMANVVLRKITDDYSLYWSDEVVRKVIFFSTYIGSVAAIRSRALIRIDALPQMFPLLKKPLTMMSHVAVLFFSGIMTWIGLEMTISIFNDEYALTATLRLPEWIFYAVLPLMGAMMFVRTLIVMAEDWSGTLYITGGK
jgi:C4-dicarboxylate transporter DctQ subunit